MNLFMKSKNKPISKIKNITENGQNYRQTQKAARLVINNGRCNIQKATH